MRRWWQTTAVVSVGVALALAPTGVRAQAAGSPAPAAGTAEAPAAGTQGATPLPEAPAAVTAQAAPATQGGTIHGVVVAGTPGKPGGVPLPGVAVTATNTLTGKKYTSATDVDGAYTMAIPRNGRYVVRAELAGFAVGTTEVLLNGTDPTATVKPYNFGLELASRAAAAEQRQEAAATRTTGASLGRGLQNLSVNTGDLDATDASAATGNTGTAMPSLGNLSDASNGTAGASESIAVSGQTGVTNGLAGFSEDEIRERVQQGVDQARASGMLPPGADPTNAIVGVLGGMMGGPGGGGRGGGPGGGGGRGGRGGGGGGFGGSGAFRNFNPAQPHGNIFYQGGNSALNSAPWSPTLLPQVNPSAYSNRFGASIAGSPYIPGLFKPNTKQFAFLNITGQKNLNAFLPNPVRVPTVLERQGNFSQSAQLINGVITPVTLYDPRTGAPIPGNNLANASVPISPQALALLNYYPAPNIVTTDPTAYNYQTISNAGSNNIALNSRFTRTIGQAVGGPFGRFGGGGPGGGGRNSNAKPTLRQNINVGFNYSHTAQDIRNIFLPLGGASASDGYGLNAGYTIGYGRLSNNASVNWNRLNSETRNYFTDTSNNPSQTIFGSSIPNLTGGFANPRFYNGVPTVSISNFQELSNTTPNQLINQTISFSDFVAWRRKKHNMRFGFDARRVHADSVGGNNPLGAFTFTGYATASPADQVSGNAGQNGTSGSGFADFLLGLPESTTIQAGLYKTYLRENVYDWYAQDDFRVLPNVTLNYGIRYEYFGPYSEKNGRLANLYPNANFSSFSVAMPGSGNSAGLVNPDSTMYAPRFGFAYRPKNAGLTKDTVIRGGYGINYNTGQFATFARNLSHQPPFAATQSNAVPTPNRSNPSPTPTGCTTTQSAYTYVDSSGKTQVRPATAANITLATGFGCSASTEAIENNWAVDRNYKLGMVQVYNLNVQRTLPLGIVFNLGYNGSKGSNLDVVGSPNTTPSGTTTPGIAPFDYEESVAGSHANALLVSVQKRQQKGIAMGVTYTYSHTIDNASGVGGAVGTPVQNFYRLDLEEGNSSFDQRHNVTGNWVMELPFGPNRAFLNKGGAWSHALDGFSFSGQFTFATGTYLTPVYSGNQAEASAANTYTQRPDRVFAQSLKGPGTVGAFFNKAAFVAPAAGQYGTASQGSIEGPGTVSVNASLSRTFSFGETRSLETRVTANNVFNTVQYSGINVVENSADFGEVTSAAAMRSLLVQARYRF